MSLFFKTLFFVTAGFFFSAIVSGAVKALSKHFKKKKKRIPKAGKPKKTNDWKGVKFYN